MSSSEQGVFVEVGAWVFLVLGVLFFLAYSVLYTGGSKKQSIAYSAAIVSCVTSAVNFAQIEGISRVVRPDGAVVYWLEWAGYSVSLFFIGSSLFRFLDPAASRGSSLYSGLSLTVVGLGGALGLFVDGGHRPVQAAVYSLTSIVYGLWVAEAWQNSRSSTTNAVLVYFVASTLLYLLGYLFGPPVLGCWSLPTEKGVYFFGNLLTKALLPVIEISLTSRE